MNAKQFLTETSNIKLIKRLRAVQNNIQIFKIQDLYTIYLHRVAQYYTSNKFHRIIKNLLILSNLQTQMHTVDMNNNAIILTYHMPHFYFSYFS
jgi:hypothetical protein